MRLLFLQHGDFADDYRRLAETGTQMYRDQKASVDFVAGLSGEHDVTVLSICGRVYEDRLAERLKATGIATDVAHDRAKLYPLLDAARPDLIVCRSPKLLVMLWARRRGVPTLPVFADLLAAPGPKQWAKSLAMRAVLAARVFPCVANHSLNASLSVASVLRYPRRRIVPWDWSRLDVDPAVKTPPADPKRVRAFFAGSLSEAKGVGDCIAAAALLRDRGIHLSLDLAGPGARDGWAARAADLGVADRVTFAGRITHEAVRERMRAADLVIVPSHHDYAEGLPNTIYEALAARTPLLVSDHPAFAGRLRPGEDCMVFKAGDAADLADAIVATTGDATLHATLSRNGAGAHERLYVGMEWAELVRTFLDDPRDATGWVSAHSLAALGT